MIISAKEVMFLSAFACFLARLHRKLLDRFSEKAVAMWRKEDTDVFSW